MAASFRPGKLAVTNAAGFGDRLRKEDFWNRSALMVLRPGLEVSGCVVGDDARPIGGAQVTKNRRWDDPFASTTTDSAGRFCFRDVPPGELILTVRADGFLAQDAVVANVKPCGELRFALDRSATLAGKVADEQGEPVVKASVGARGGDFDRRFTWSTLTDSEGKFRWLSAPPQHTEYRVSGSGFNPRAKVELIPDGTERTIVLQRQARDRYVRISGTAADAYNHQPISDFEVWVSATVLGKGSFGSGQYVGLAPELATTGSEGKFSFIPRRHFSDSPIRLEVEVKAEGYSSARQTIPGNLTSNCELQFQLQPVAMFNHAAEAAKGKQ